mmetsp:Transcript_14749/g.28387  ORF Transcript_14749/g.28387 Transcript_14749/m.28387 type:complete len:200 (-) Transcript_14749:1594-2193(-)
MCMNLRSRRASFPLTPGLHASHSSGGPSTRASFSQWLPRIAPSLPNIKAASTAAGPGVLVNFDSNARRPAAASMNTLWIWSCVWGSSCAARRSRGAPDSAALRRLTTSLSRLPRCASTSSASTPTGSLKRAISPSMPRPFTTVRTFARPVGSTSRSHPAAGTALNECAEICGDPSEAALSRMLSTAACAPGTTRRPCSS